jgi:hypothetical protein
MGYIKHHTIVVTSWNEEKITEAHAKASSIFRWVSPLSPAVSDWRSFFIPPDGSSEGWDESDAGDARRTAFIDWCQSKRTEDGGSYLQWVEVSFGEDDYQPERVERGTNMDRPADKDTPAPA